MTVTEEPITTVVDAGGRYGVHPSWKEFRGKLSYHLFEPDPEEADRLKQKYAARDDSVHVHPIALGERCETLRFNMLRHRGQSSVLAPIKQSFWFAEARPSEGDIIGAFEAPCDTLDNLRSQQNIVPDFLKLDTEGFELPILRGAAKCLESSVIGIRSESHFDAVFEGMPLFPELHQYLSKFGFVLLNLDYSGSGVPWSEFTEPGRFGMLVGCDSVWIKRPQILFESQKREIAAVRTLKLAAFCMANNATDVAVRLLLDGTRERGLRLAEFAETRLGANLDRTIQILFNRLRSRPPFAWEHLENTYRELFDREPKLLHRFFESDEINPD